MIDVKELRIGVNIYEKIHNNCGVHLVVREVTEDLLEVLFAARNYDDFEPIPLTPEILLKCGFKRKELKGSITYFKNGGTFYFSILFDEIGNYFLFDSPHYGRVYKTLHELQNLYFALTGEELEVNLNHTAPSQHH